MFRERTGLDGADKRVGLAAHPHHHRLLRDGYTFEPAAPSAGTLAIGTYHPPTGPSPAPAPRGRGRPEDEDFNACVMATTALVDGLIATRHPRQRRRHDFVAVTIAMIWPGGWLGTAARGARGIEDLHDRIKDTYYRVQRRNTGSSRRRENKATSKPNKATLKRRTTALKRK